MIFRKIEKMFAKLLTNLEKYSIILVRKLGGVNLWSIKKVLIKNHLRQLN